MATRAEWSKRVARWQKSGLSAEEFAEREGLKSKRLVWWRWKLRSSLPPSPPDLRFLPVHVVDPPVPVQAMGSGAWLEVALPNGRVVRVPPGFEPAMLKRVLAVASEDGPC
jgi:transposase